jgi:hypothetical protein
VAKRAGIWADDPDLIAFAALVEALAARGPPAVPPGHRYGSGIGGGAAYYRDVELWAQTPRPDIIAFRALVTELQQRQQAETEERFVTRLRARLAAVASLSIADRRQAIGCSDEYIAVALSGRKVPAPIAARLQAFLASEPA